jgi:putative transposase
MMQHVITAVPTVSPKNETIKATLKATKARRKQQRCRVFEVKLDSSHLNQHTKEHLKRLFLEAKWLYNYILSQPNVFDIDYKLSEVPVKVKDTFELRELRHLSSQMKQSLIRRTIDNIKGLARLKEKGHKIGALKYKSCVNTIPLKQYGKTYRILNDKYLKIQGISQHLRVNGLAQIPASSELANATLIQRHGDYFVAITTYQTREHTPPPTKTVGIDFGVKTQLTLSDGIAIQYAIPISNKLRKLHRKLSRCHFRSKNWYKTKRKLEKAYAKVNNIKKDVKNKLVHYLHTTYGVVCYQDENVKAWQRLWGSKILSTAIGGIIRTLETKVHTPIQIDRWFPSTKTCSRCGNIRDIGLDERIYVCPVCGLVMDRDHNSGVNIENEGLQQLVPTGRRDVKPVETESSTLAALEYLNGIPYVKASSVVEAGSLTASA